MVIVLKIELKKLDQFNGCDKQTQVLRKPKEKYE